MESLSFSTIVQLICFSKLQIGITACSFFDVNIKNASVAKARSNKTFTLQKHSPC